MYNIMKLKRVLLLALVLKGLEVQGVILHFARKSFKYTRAQAG